MTILSVCQSAGTRLTGTRPTSVFGTSDQFISELIDLVGEAASDMAKRHDWQALTSLQTLTGDGTTEEFALPSDFDRMTQPGNIYSTRSFMPLRKTRDLNQWLEFQIEPVVGYPGYWIILDNKTVIKPPMADGESAKFYYITNKIFRNESNTPITTPSANTDVFRLSERVLALGVVWRWRAMKRLEYGEDMQNYEIALEREIMRDRGSNILAIGAGRLPADVSIAYPGEIVP